MPSCPPTENLPDTPQYTSSISILTCNEQLGHSAISSPFSISLYKWETSQLSETVHKSQTYDVDGELVTAWARIQERQFLLAERELLIRDFFINSMIDQNILIQNSSHTQPSSIESNNARISIKSFSLRSKTLFFWILK